MRYFFNYESMLDEREMWEEEGLQAIFEDREDKEFGFFKRLLGPADTMK